MEDIFDKLEERRKWLESLPDGVPCDHRGCLSHISHPCESCGRIGGKRLTLPAPDAVVCACTKRNIPGVGEVLIVGNCPIHRAGKA